MLWGRRQGESKRRRGQRREGLMGFVATTVQKEVGLWQACRDCWRVGRVRGIGEKEGEGGVCRTWASRDLRFPVCMCCRVAVGLDVPKTDRVLHQRRWC